MGQLDTVVDAIYQEVRGFAEDAKKVKGLAGFGSIIALVIRKVETVKDAMGTLTGAQKKEIASEVLNRMIDLPIIPEWLESRVFGVAVDWFVDFFNRTFGKNWKDAVARIPF